MRHSLITTMVAAICLLPLVARAQNGPPAPGPGGAGGPGGPGGFGGGFGGRGGGGFNIADIMKQQLGVSDDEWQVLEPKFMKVLQMRFAVQGVSRFGGRGPGGPGGPGGGPGGGAFGGGGPGGPGGAGAAGGFAALFPSGDDPVSVANNDLQTALADPNTPAETLTAKVEALRAAREKARNDLAAAQKDLKDVLSLRQEATLVTWGLLD